MPEIEFEADLVGLKDVICGLVKTEKTEQNRRKSNYETKDVRKS